MENVVKYPLADLFKYEDVQIKVHEMENGYQVQKKSRFQDNNTTAIIPW